MSRFLTGNVREKRRLSLAVALLLGIISILIAGACKAAPPAATADDRVVQLNIITIPVAIDLDGKPGPDGAAVKVYAATAKHPKAIRLREGKIEILMFDGAFQNRTNPPPVLRTFLYEAKELRLYEFNSEIGWGYQFTLNWGTNKPTQRLMSIGARFTPPEGRPVVSRTSSVTVLSK